jgi:UDP-galactose transporter B1
MGKVAPKEASPISLIIGVVGIYGAFMYYGFLQAEVVKFTSPDGEKLEREWFLQTLEALANVILGAFGLYVLEGGPSKLIPWKGFAISGTTQVLAKAMTQKSMIYGVPFFVATLVKNAKMVPVMIGSIVMSGKTYPIRKYVQVFLIIAGVVIVSIFKSKKPALVCHIDSDCKANQICSLSKHECIASSSSEASSLLKDGRSSSSSLSDQTEMFGLFFLCIALLCDGITGGTQDSMKKEYNKTCEEKLGCKGKLKPYDLMLFTNLFMMFIALTIALTSDQFFGGVAFILANPEIASKVLNFVICSALGQSAIFFTLAKFDPLVTTTVTTTRKIFSVLLDIFTQGHVLNSYQWAGVGVASFGVILELQEKFGGGKPKAKGSE